MNQKYTHTHRDTHELTILQVNTAITSLNFGDQKPVVLFEEEKKTREKEKRGEKKGEKDDVTDVEVTLLI